MSLKRSATALLFGLQAVSLATALVVVHPEVAHAAAAGAAWTQLTPGRPPFALVGGFAYDTALDKAVYFGGLNVDSFTYSTDMWAFDGVGWSQIPKQAVWPSARDFVQMVYDSDRNRIVLFGGFDGSRGLNDTWEWDGSRWTQVAVSGPTTLYGGAMVYDSARKRTLLFSGDSRPGTTVGATWSWDGASWTQLQPATAPSARYFSAMVFDTARGRAVLFGGSGTGGRLGDTWEWDGATWTQVSTSSAPTPRWGMALGYDAANARTMLFGGDTFPNDNLTWEWDGVAWTRDFPTVSPAPSVFYQMVYDPTRQRLVVYGGDHEANPDTYARETWSLTAPSIQTTLTLAAASGFFGGSTLLTASARTADGLPVAGTVTFTLSNGSTVSAATDSSGKATVSLGLGRLAPGDYGLSASLSAARGYTPSSAAGSVKILPAPLTVTVGDASKTYGQPDPTFSATFSGLVAGDTPASLGTLAFSTLAAGVGDYPIFAAGLDPTDYSITYVPGILHVLPAPLTVRTDDVSRWYNAANPLFTVTLSGLVNGERPEQFSGVTFNTSATSASPVGTYAVTPAGLVAPNYRITYIPGALLVLQDQINFGRGSPDTTLAGDPISVVVLVIGPPGTYAISEGTVTLTNDKGVVLCDQLPVVGGAARCTLRPESVGVHTYIASYTGTANVADRAGPWTQTVSPHN